MSARLGASGNRGRGHAPDQARCVGAGYPGPSGHADLVIGDGKMIGAARSQVRTGEPSLLAGW
jgi:hypothetical protein